MTSARSTAHRACLCALVIALTGAGPGCRGGRGGDAAGEPDPDPGERQGTEPAGDGDHDDAAGLPGTPDEVVRSILDHVEAGSSDGGRYVDLSRDRDRWVLTGRRTWRRAALNPDAPLPVDTTPSTIRVPSSLVGDGCLHAHVSAGGAARLVLRGEDGRRDKLTVEEGQTLVTYHCGATSSPHLEFSIASRDPDGPGVLLQGLWIAPAGRETGPDDLPRIRACAGGEGWTVEPGTRLEFDAWMTPADGLEWKAEGPGAEDVRVSLLTDPAGERRAPGSAASGEGRWRPALDRTGAVRIRVTTQGDGDACLGRLAIRSPAPTGRLDALPPVEGVVVILVDTLRADALPVWDDESPVETPAFDGLAGESLVFTRTTANSHYTKPSVATILTGLNPSAHGALTHESRLRPEVRLLPQILAPAGVVSHAVFSNHFLNNSKFGFWKGWQRKAHVNSYTACMGGEPVVEEVARWLEEEPPESPFFAYIHLMDPHSPYNAPIAYQMQYLGYRLEKGRFLPRTTSSFIREFRRGDVSPPTDKETGILRSLYQADVAHADSMLEAVIAELESSGILDRSLLVVTSDHGEEFMEHGGLGHGTNLRQELVHVPLLMRWPGARITGVVDSQVGHVDVAPTVLDALGVPRPSEMRHGRSIYELLVSGPAPGGPRSFLIEHRNTTEKAVVVGAWKLIAAGSGDVLIRSGLGGEVELDVEDHPISHVYMRRRLSELLMDRQVTQAPDVGSEVDLDDEERQMLEALGYLVD